MFGHLKYALLLAEYIDAYLCQRKLDNQENSKWKPYTPEKIIEQIAKDLIDNAEKKVLKGK